MAKYYAGQSIDNDKNKDYMGSLALGYEILDGAVGGIKLPTPPTQEQILAQLDKGTRKLILERLNAGEKDIGTILSNPKIKEGF
jgi:hypothetical protein